MTSPAATGAQALFGWAREDAFNQGGTDDLVYLRPIPPATVGLVRNEAPSPEINATGFRKQGTPSGVTGPFTFAASLTAATCLEPYENLFGPPSREVLETDAVFRYVFTFDRAAAVQSLRLLFAQPPVTKMQGFGMKLSQIVHAMGNNALISAAMTGFVSHGTRLSEATPDGGNTGTYTGGPRIRGPLANPRPGEKVAATVSRDVGGGGLQWKFERYPEGATPTFPGSAVDQRYDSDGNGDWQNMVGAYQLTGAISVGAAGTAITGVGTKFLSELRVGSYLHLGVQSIKVSAVASDTAATFASAHTLAITGGVGHIPAVDFGHYDENRDPLDFLVPGDSTDHGDLDVDDLFVFDTAWSDPTPEYLDAQRFTSAHLDLQYGDLGADDSALAVMRVQTANQTLSVPVTPEIACGSQYYAQLDRDGEASVALAVTRRFRDEDFETYAEGHKRFRAVLALVGQLLGSGTHRESIAYDYPQVGIGTRTAPVAGPTATIETLNLMVEDPGDGSDVVTITVITDRDWTPAA